MPANINKGRRGTEEGLKRNAMDSDKRMNLEEFAHRLDAFRGLFQLQEVGRFREEIVVDGDDIAEIERRQIGKRQSGICADDLQWATEFRKVNEHGKRGGVVDDLRFVFPGTPEFKTLPVRASAKGRSRHKLEDARHNALEGRQVGEYVREFLPGIEMVRAAPRHCGYAFSRGVEFFVTGSVFAQRRVEQNTSGESAASGGRE